MAALACGHPVDRQRKGAPTRLFGLNGLGHLAQWLGSIGPVEDPAAMTRCHPRRQVERLPVQRRDHEHPHRHDSGTAACS